MSRQKHLPGMPRTFANGEGTVYLALPPGV